MYKFVLLRLVNLPKLNYTTRKEFTLYTHELKGLAKGEQELQLNLDKMKITNGVYFLRVSTDNSSSTTKK
jgi:hypothetical protein